MISKNILLKTFLNKPKLIVFGIQLNNFPCFYLIRKILFSINLLFALS